MILPMILESNFKFFEDDGLYIRIQNSNSAAKKKQQLLVKPRDKRLF